MEKKMNGVLLVRKKLKNQPMNYILWVVVDCQCGTFSSHENTMANLWHPLRGLKKDEDPMLIPLVFAKS
ncbi:hypothetical protein J1N35_000845 [Gossypium stocksii]|uniref:Uncharacterized protein n=1 Tax=Gossypium stocksii TaxID=47602 RepID=A0A9D4AKH5_9ROSI|nr:hypothetical protein J1N35_000845 [Gossypium stocksii]